MLLLDSLRAAGPEKIEDKIRQFVMDIYKVGGKEEFDVAFDKPFEIPKVPQQKDDKNYGQYVLYYIYKFLLACPKYFNIDKDFPGFMGENWFTNNEVEEFCAELPAKGETTDFSKKVEIENSSVQSPAVFEPFDALRALVLYNPQSR
ncbi:hypothetical protein POM88_050087 [Heracleum sosnowskyi]|uniref:Uncharacterized protein n=1 Tax=Heracleum sosnowskyi TaxID=360622 RepID=A0AAD8GZM2_9APIA|nr:hypothetical protein POM88_050087 [Heracleum sosnowskyi]